MTRAWRGPLIGLLLLVLLATAATAVSQGAVDVAWHTLWTARRPAPGDAHFLHHAVIVEVRLPRVLMAMLTGAALASAGVFLQALFRNPLADPALIGVSAGAALGAVSMVVLGATWLGGLAWLLGAWALPSAAFAGAVLASILIFALARSGGDVQATTLLLCGIAINALAGALIGLMTYLATDDQLRNLTFWSLGSLAGATWPAVKVMVPVVASMLVLGWRIAPAANALLLGEAQALHLGIPVETLKRIIVAASAACAGAAVAFTGMVGFVGLVAPHLARLMVGPDHRYVFPLAAILGAWLLTVGDLLARTVARPAELPLGILTALLGAPFFLWLIKRRRWSGS